MIRIHLFGLYMAEVEKGLYGYTAFILFLMGRPKLPHQGALMAPQLCIALMFVLCSSLILRSELGESHIDLFYLKYLEEPAISRRSVCTSSVFAH